MLLPRVCNPCMLNVGVGPHSRGSLDNSSDRLNFMGISRSPIDGTAHDLESAVRRCESTLPKLKRESSDHRNTKELQDERTRRATAEACAMEAEIQEKALKEDMINLSARLQRLSQEARQACAEQASYQSVAVDIYSAYKAVATHAEHDTHDASLGAAQSKQTCVARTCVTRGECAIM